MKKILADIGDLQVMCKYVYGFLGDVGTMRYLGAQIKQGEDSSIKTCSQIMTRLQEYHDFGGDEELEKAGLRQHNVHSDSGDQDESDQEEEEKVEVDLDNPVDAMRKKLRDRKKVVK
jgi:hypothetical protein